VGSIRLCRSLQLTIGSAVGEVTAGKARPPGPCALRFIVGEIAGGRFVGKSRLGMQMKNRRRRVPTRLIAFSGRTCKRQVALRPLHSNLAQVIVTVARRYVLLTILLSNPTTIYICRLTESNAEPSKHGLQGTCAFGFAVVGVMQQSGWNRFQLVTPRLLQRSS
jgi:hypothetical protein